MASNHLLHLRVESKVINTDSVSGATQYLPTLAYFTPIETITLGNGKAGSALAEGQYVTLTWEHILDLTDPDSEAVNVRIYRKGPSDANRIPIGLADSAANIFVDPIDNNPSAPDPIPGETYVYTIRSFTTAGWSRFTALRTATTPLYPPTDLSASDGIASSIKLTWQKAEGATRYEVYRDTQDSPYRTVSDETSLPDEPATPDDREWVDINVPDFNTHTYWLKAANQYSRSGFSTPDDGHIKVGPIAVLTIQNGQESGTAPHLVNFDASGSIDHDGGDIANFNWDWEGDGTFDFDSGTDSTVNYTYLVGNPPGEPFNPVVEITDDEGEKDTASVVVDVNDPPVAALSANPLSGNQPLTVNFDASASTDNGTITDYEWDFDGDGVFNETDNGEDLEQGNLTTEYTYTDPGTFNPAVRVTDNGGAQSEDSAVIDVSNTPPTANLTADPMSGAAPLTVDFDATGSTDSDGTIDKYEYDFDEGSGWEDYGTNATPSHEYTDPGTYTAQLRVTDNDGATDTASIEIIAGGRGDWWMRGREPKHNGRSPFVGPATNALDWSITTGGWVYSSPAIGVEGTVYVGSYDFNLYATNPDGTPLWTYPTGGEVYSSPAIGTDGRVYFGSIDNNVYAINPDGTEHWAFATGGSVRSSPAIGTDGTVYVGCDDNNLYAINPDGSERWSFPTGGILVSSPAIAADGTIYVGSDDQKLYAINPDGTEQWSYLTGGPVQSSPAISTDGKIYVGNGGNDDKLYAINQGGTLFWSYPMGADVFSSPAIAADGTVYVGSHDSKLYAINEDGSLNWSYTTGGFVYSSPAIDAGGTIYVGSEDTKLYAINPAGSLLWSYTTGGQVYSSPAIGADGTLYVGCNDWKLYAFGPGNGPVAVLTADPVDGTFPLTVNFDASDSFYVDGTITDYEWDFDGNGVFNEASNGEDTAQGTTGPSPTYSTWGVYRAVVRVTSNDAKTDTASIDIGANFTWHTHTVDTTGVQGFTTIAVHDGKAVVAYKGNNQDLAYARASVISPSSGSDWALHYITSDNSSYTSIQILGGKPIVSHHYEPGNELWYASSNAAEPTSSSNWTIHTVDNTGTPAEGGNSMVILDGKPAIAYYESIGGDLVFARATTAPNSSDDWSIHVVDSTDDVGKFCSLAILDGKPVISYFDETADDLYFARATTSTPSSSGDWQIHAVDTDGVSGQYSSLVVLDGMPAMSYFHDSLDGLMFARATTATPSSSNDWDIHAIDLGDLGYFSSMELLDGRPVVSYWDQGTNDDLKVALALTPSPTSSSDWILYTVDSTGDVGMFSSLAIINNQPYISYYDNTNGDLKFARPE